MAGADDVGDPHAAVREIKVNKRFILTNGLNMVLPFHLLKDMPYTKPDG